MSDIIYLSCQPAIPRFAWEVEVYVNNFIDMGVDPSNIHVVLGLDVSSGNIPSDWIKLRDHYAPVKFFFYDDTRGHNTYQPSLQAHILEKHWKANPYMEQEAVFFHDADFIFTKPFDFSAFLGDDIWYLSDTISYIGADYIKSKGDEVFNAMCDIAGLDPRFVELQQLNSGGAQKLMKKIPTHYWTDSFNMQMELWEKIPPISNRIKEEKKGEDYMVLQHWTMSMWAELWMAWKIGRETRVSKRFDFHFAIDHIDKWNDRSFFHNAGVVDESRGIFFKGKFNDKLPYGYEIPNVNKQVTGWKYFQYIQEVGKKSCLV
jgi:hypothetical protein